MKMEIKLTNGQWLVNGKRLSELNSVEERFMNDFFREVKLKQARKDEEVKNFIKRQALEQSASINYVEYQKQL